jgi:DNA-binding NarL/FixJ family response regulator
MRFFGFILVVDSYLVRKGVAALLNRIQGVRMLKEFDTTDPLAAYLEAQPVDYIIISQLCFDSAVDLFISKPELLEKTILIEENQKERITSHRPVQGVHTSIHLMEEEGTLIRKIRDLLDQSKGKPAENRSMQLSPRETTIVQLVSKGLTNRQIAEKLFLSAHTVMTHRKNISGKLGIKSVSGLTIYAIVNNIITIEEVTSKPEQ